MLEHWSYLAPQLFLSVYLHTDVGPPCLQATALSGPPVTALLGVFSTRLPISAPPTSLNECFFNSLVVGLPYNLIFWQFWSFLFLNLWLSFFWLCEEAKCIHLHLHLGQKSPILKLEAGWMRSEAKDNGKTPKLLESMHHKKQK